MRFTMYVWQRLKEGKNSMILKTKDRQCQRSGYLKENLKNSFMAITLT